MASTVDDDTLPHDSPSEPVVQGATVHSYRLGRVLGRGGMGEVVLAHDPSLCRDVAIKRMRTSAPSPATLARFEREARIQARLDHPAIVPVHEIGRDERGEPYFTMKPLAGTTLADVLARRSETPQKLLRALADICLAIELAHERQIVHRDLKPSNIMLGGYGEVYVLDWGVARVLDRDLLAQTELEADPLAGEGGTQAGSLLGTPGYMAPEQVRGEDVGPPADVYALGAILFEILTGTRLHPPGVAALASTLELEDPSPARRCPECTIAPELDAACTAALALDPAARPSARGLAERLQHYLDGDRDLEARRALAIAELEAARRALAEARRADAVHHAGRAVAFDPQLGEAVSLLTSLIVEPPRELPPEVAAAAAAEEEHQRRQRSRRAVLPFFAVPVVAAVFGPTLAPSSLTELLVQTVLALGMSTLSFVNWRVRAIPTWGFLLAHFVLGVAFTRWGGPFLMTPSVLFALVLSLALQPWVNERPRLLLGWALATMGAPFVLEGLGVVSSTWTQSPAGLTSYGAVFPPSETSQTAALAITVSTHLAAILVFASYALAISRDARRAQRGLFVQAWHLRQLLPREPAAHP